MKKRALAMSMAVMMAAGALSGCARQTGTETSSAGSTAVETQTTAAQTAESSGSPASTTITFWHSMGGVNGEAMNSLVT